MLDTFFGSGTTGAACLKEGFHVLGIEQDRDFHKLGRKRLRLTAKDAKPELMKALFAPRSSK